jgi:hypothetical protein
MSLFPKELQEFLDELNTLEVSANGLGRTFRRSVLKVRDL